MTFLLVKEKLTKRTDIIEHRISTDKSNPPRKMSFAKQQETFSIIREILDEVVIEKSSAPWLPTAVLISKKDGPLDFVFTTGQFSSA